MLAISDLRQRPFLPHSCCGLTISAASLLLILWVVAATLGFRLWPGRSLMTIWIALVLVGVALLCVGIARLAIRIVLAVALLTTLLLVLSFMLAWSGFRALGSCCDCYAPAGRIVCGLR